MQMFTSFLEFALILALVAVWWMARRDLLMLVTHQQTPTLREMERVQASIEQLLERLDAQTEEAERRAARPSEPQAPHNAASPDAPDMVSSPPRQEPTLETSGLSAHPGSETRYAEVYRLADAGCDPEEIAQRTGLGSGEVRLVISLRPAA